MSGLRVTICFWFLIIVLSHSVESGDDDEDEPAETEDSEEEFNKKCIKMHNKYRKKHDAQKLELDDNAIKVAKRHVKRKETSEDDEEYGFNRFWATRPHLTDCKDATKQWYEGVDKYDWSSPKYKKGSAGFTQLVWKNSKSLGCARVAKKIDGRKYGRSHMWKVQISCAYSPAGNVQGQYKRNVVQKNEELEKGQDDEGNLTAI